MKLRFFYFIVLLLCLSFFGANNNISYAKDKTKPKLESLLKEAKIEYLKTDNYFKIPLTIGDETTIIFVSEMNMVENDPATNYINIGLQVASIPENFNPSLPMLKEINKINNELDFGKVSFDATIGVIFSSGFWANLSSPENLINELYHAHYRKLAIKKALLPYIQE